MSSIPLCFTTTTALTRGGTDTSAAAIAVRTRLASLAEKSWASVSFCSARPTPRITSLRCTVISPASVSSMAPSNVAMRSSVSVSVRNVSCTTVRAADSGV